MTGDTRAEVREKLEAAKELMSEALVISIKLPNDEISGYLAMRLEDMFTAVEYWLTKEHQFRNKVGEYA